MHDGFLIVISVASLPTDYEDNFNGAKAVTSPSGKGAIVQHQEHLYELKCEVSGCSWTILPQKLKQGVEKAILLALPVGTRCD